MATKLVFQYEGGSTFGMSVYPHSQEFQISRSFIHVLIDTHAKSMVIFYYFDILYIPCYYNDNCLFYTQDLPSCFFIHNYDGKVGDGILNLQLSENHNWKLKIKEVDSRFKLIGWKNVVDEAPLLFGSFLVFHFVSKSQMRLSVYDASGVNILLHANSKEVEDVGTKKGQLSEECQVKPTIKRFLGKATQCKVSTWMKYRENALYFN